MSQVGRYQLGSGSNPPIETLTGNTGGPVGPDAAFNIDVVGDTTTITVAGNPATNTLTISTTGSIATQYDTDAGNAVPAAGILNVFGGHDINTAGAGNTVTIHLDNAITLGDLAVIAPGSPALTATTGNIEVTAGNILMPNTTSSNSGQISFGGARFITNFGAGGAAANTFIGSQSGNLSLTTSSSNSGLGANVLQSLTIGDNNGAFGSGSLFSVTTGSNNNAGGLNSQTLLVVGNNNSSWGGNSLQSLISGSYNSTLGYNTGINYTGAESSNILINNNGVLGESNVLRIGVDTGVGVQELNAAYISGIYNIAIGATSGVVLCDSNNKLGSSNGTDGQVLIGGGTAPVWANITAGTGITITNAANSIDISSSGGGISWTVVTGASQNMAVNNGYIANNAGTINFSLPATSAVGSVLRLTGINNATGWQITQAAGQQIFFGASSTTLGAAGTLTSSATRDSVELVCVVADTIWNVISSIGNPTIV